MTQILKFPARSQLAPVQAKDGSKHRIALKVLDELDPRRTRWILQWEIQEVAGYGEATKGFTDRAVADGERHRFTVTSTLKLRRFLARTSTMLADGDVAIWVDGQRVRPLVRRKA